MLDDMRVLRDAVAEYRAAATAAGGPRDRRTAQAKLKEARAALEPLVGKVWSYCEGSAIRGRTVTLKAKYADFQQITRSRTLDEPVASLAGLEAIASALAEPLFPVAKGIRLLGVTLSSLDVESATHAGRQLLLPF